jgi:hypothetical protein
MRTPLPQSLLASLTYLRALLASAYPDNWAKLKKGIRSTPLWDLSIAPRWKWILEEDWSAIPITPFPIVLDMATLQHSLASELARQRAPIEGTTGAPKNIALHFQSLDVEGRIHGKQILNGKDTQ